MPRTLYCWRCDMELPMLDESEWAQLEPMLANAIGDLVALCRETGMGLGEARSSGLLGGRALSFYRQLTGFEETNLNALHHHRLSLYGPPCTSCGKPLRTPRAKLCAACGHPRPLPASS